MKPKSTLRSFLILAGSSMLAATSVTHAATLTWDANGATAGLTDGAGAWDTATELKWWTGSTNVDWTSGDSAIFGNGGAGGAVSLASPTAVGLLTFNYFTGTYTIGSATQTITLSNGITKNPGSGTVAIAAPITLDAAQTWTNNSTTAIQPSGAQTLDNGGFNLTIGGSGLLACSPSGGNTLAISGAGGLIKNGTGSITLDSNPVVTHTFTGNIEVNGGSIGFQTAAVFSGKNTKLTNGYLGGRYGSGFTWTGGLGTGANQIQITGGVSGLSGEGNVGSTFQIGGALSLLTWGNASFNPTVLIANGDARMNANGKGSLNNTIDLNGANRTITSLQSTDGAANSGFTISGAISNGAGTAGLIKTGVGNLILGAANTYNGATTINGGSITLSAAAATINSSNALNLGGGTLRLVNTAQVNRFADGAAVTSNGGTISYENTAGTNLNYTETIGSVALTTGQLNLALTGNQNNATNNSQTLTINTGGITRTATTNTSAVTFSAATTGPQATGSDNMIFVTGAGTTTATQIVGPWATVGTAANAQTDYAAYNADYVVPAAIAASAETLWTAATNPYTMDFSTAGTTLTATRNIGSLRIIGGTPLTSVDIANDIITLTGHPFIDGNTVVFGTGAPGGLTAGTTYFVVSAAVDTFKVSAALAGAPANLTSVGTAPTVVPSSAPTLALSTGNNLGTHGILNGSPYAISITPGTGGSVTLPTTSAGQLHVNTGSNAITISAPITDNTGALTLVKNGSAGTLILTAANNAYTGDTIINAGTLQVGASGINTQLNGGTYAGNIFIARGAALTFQGNASNTLSGDISGDGNLNLNRGTTTLSGANTYTGATSMSLVPTNGLGSTLSVSSFNSVVGGTASSSLGAPTTVANGTIGFGGGGIQQSLQINYTGSGETTDRIINFQFNGNGANRTIDASGSGLLKFTSPPISNGAANNNVVLQGSSNGEFVGGLPFAFVNFTKNGAGTWTLGGSIGNTGTTTISAGTLILNGTKYGAGTVAVNGTSTLGGSGTIAGVVTVAAGAKLSPGSSSVGTLTFRNDLNISALAGAVNAGLLNYDLGSIASSDKIVVTGNLNIGADLLRLSDFNFTALGGLQNGTYKLITSGAPVTGTLDTNPANLTGTVGTGSGTLQISGGGTGNDIELVVSGITGGGNTFANWIATYPGVGAFTGVGDDADGDGIDNGAENFFGTNPSVSSSGLVAGAVGVGTFTFTHPQNATPASDLTPTYQWSKDLATFYGSGVSDGSTTVTLTPVLNTPVAGTTTVTATVTGTATSKLFVRVKVTQP